MALKMKLGRLTGPLNCCQWCDFSSRSWTLFEQHLNRCQRRTEQVNAKAATTEASKKMDFLKCKRNYRCDSCDFHAARPKPLLLHVKEAHQPNLEIFSCELCNYASRFKAKVTQHKRLCHSVQAPDDASDSVSRDESSVSGTVRDACEGTEKVATSTKTERVVGAKSSGKKRKHPESKVSSDKAEEHKKSVKRHKSGKEFVPPSNTSTSVNITDSGHASDSAGHSSKISMPPLSNANKPSTVKVLKSKSWGKEGAKGKGVPNGSVDSLKLIIKDVSVKSANSRIIRYKCQLCSFLHSRRESIVKHLRSVHGKKVGHSCPKCDFVAKSKAKLASHILSHNKRRYRCPDCSFKTLSKHRFLEHRACHVISGLYACHRCSFSSNTESSVISHRTDHHDKSDSRDNKNSGSDTRPPLLVKYTHDQISASKTSSEIQCDFCDSTFSSRSEVSEHMLAVHPGGSVIHKCSVCLIVYKCRRSLNTHMKQKHGFTLVDHQQPHPKDEADESVSVPDAAAAAAAATDATLGLLPKLEKVVAASDSEEMTNEVGKPNKAKSEKVRKLSLSKSNHLKGTDLQRKKDLIKGIVSGDWNTVKKHEEDSSSKDDSSAACATDDKNSTGVGEPGKMQNLPEIAVLLEGSRTIFRCVKCSSRHTNKVSLESHLSRGHPGSILYHCPLCKYGALWRLSMKNHLKNHRKEAKTLEGLRILLEQSFRLAAVGTSSLSSQQDTATQDPSRIVPAENSLDVPSQDGIMFKMPKSNSVVKNKKEWKSKAPCVKEEPRLQIKTEVVDVDEAEIKCAEKQLPANKTKPGRWYCTDCNTDCKNALKLGRHKERHANLKRFMCSACGLRSNYDFYIRTHIQKNHRPNAATMQILTVDEAKRTIAKYPKRGKLVHSPAPKADKVKLSFGQKAKTDKTKLGCDLKPKAEKTELNFGQTPKGDKTKLNFGLKSKPEKTTEPNFSQMPKAESSGMSAANIDHPEESKDFLTTSGTRISLCKIKTEPEDKKPDVGVVVQATGNNRRKYLKWLCDQCTYASDSPAKLTSHKEVHENLKRFLCPVCGVRSNWILYVQSHIKKAHRSAKVSVVELSREEARRTLPDHLKQCKGSSPSKAKKSQMKPKSSKSKDTTRLQDSKISQQSLMSNKNVPMNEPEPSGVGQNCSESPSGKNSKRSLFDCLDGSLEMFSGVSVGANLNPTKSRDVNVLSASTDVLSTSKVCKYKKFKCSVCGMRSNWATALRKHRQLLHPHAKTIVMPISDAKASLAVYDSELKPVIAAANMKSAADARDNLHKLKALKRLKPSKKHRLKKLKINSGLVMYGCSQCTYKTKYRSNAKKHIAGVHPTAEIHETDNSCVEGLASVQPNERNSKVYSCSECGLRSELLVAMKKHIADVHSSASILRLSLSTPSIFPNPHVSPSGLRTPEPPKQESPTAGGVVASDWNSFKKSIANCSEPCSSSPIASAPKYNRPMNFACSGCNRRMDRRMHVVRHIRSAHPNQDCHVIHKRRYERRFSSKQLQIGSTDRRRETAVEKSASINADGGFEFPQSVHDGSDGIQRCSNILDCDICPYRAPRHNQLLRHRKLHEERPGYTFECTFCPYFCPSGSCLQRHLQLHTTARVVSSSTSHPLEDHAYSQSPPPVNGKGEYSCDKCPFMSESCQRFVYHKQFHRPRPAAAYRCDVCPFWVPDSKMLVQHAKLHERFSRQLAQQSDESYILDDVVETARIKWDIIAAKCVPATTGVQCAPGNVSGEARSTDNSEGRVPTRRSSSPRSQLAQKSFTEMWLSGSLVGSENASVHEENSSDTLETSSSLASKNTGDDISKNGQLKDESDFGRTDHGNNNASEFELPATRSWHCEKCPYLTVTVVHFRRHMSLHGSQQRYECQFCDYSVPRYFLLLQHKKLHLSPNRNLLFSQPISSLQCISQLDNGSEHFLKEITFVPLENEPTFFEDTPDFRLPSKLFRCSECPYSTIRHKVLVTHQKHHTVRAAFACPFCSYSVSDQRRLNLHVVEHFNLPGSEMSAYSASEAPDLMEAMKAEIVRISGRSMVCPVSAKVVDDQLAEIAEDGGHAKQAHGVSDGTSPVPGGDLLVQRSMVADSSMLNPGRKMLDDGSASDTRKSILDGSNALASSIDIIDDDSTLVAGERMMDGDDGLNGGSKISYSKPACDNEEDSENLIMQKEAQTEMQPCEANPGDAKSSLGSGMLDEALQPELDFQIVRNADYDEDRETSDADSVYQAVICKADERIRSDEEQHGELTDGENITLIDDKGKLVLSSSVRDEDANRFPDGVHYEQVNPVCIIDSPIPDNEYAGHQAIVETFAIFKVETTSLEQMNGSAALAESGRADGNDEEDDILFISESESEMESSNCVEKDQSLRAEQQIAEQISVQPKVDACEERDESAEDEWHVTVNDEEDLYIELSPEPEEIDEQSLDCADVDHRISEDKESDFKQSQLTLTPGENPS